MWQHAGRSWLSGGEGCEADNGRIIRRVNADALGHFRKLIRGGTTATTRQLIAAIFCLDMQKNEKKKKGKKCKAHRVN